MGKRPAAEAATCLLRPPVWRPKSGECQLEPPGDVTADSKLERVCHLMTQRWASVTFLGDSIVREMHEQVIQMVDPGLKKSKCWPLIKIRKASGQPLCHGDLRAEFHAFGDKYHSHKDAIFQPVIDATLARGQYINDLVLSHDLAVASITIGIPLGVKPIDIICATMKHFATATPRNVYNRHRTRMKVLARLGKEGIQRYEAGNDDLPAGVRLEDVLNLRRGDDKKPVWMLRGFKSSRHMLATIRRDAAKNKAPKKPRTE